MEEQDRKDFFNLVADVYGFYRTDCTKFALNVWWESCRQFNFSAVRDAFNRHAMNPDNGQFCPKPADLVKLIGGGTQDGALVAWSKVNKAIRSIGPYQTVVFDDPIIHKVISDMGGWISLGNLTEEELPFKAKEFENRYRGYRIRGEISEVPEKLIGLADADRIARGLEEAQPVAIGMRNPASFIKLGFLGKQE